MIFVMRMKFYSKIHSHDKLNTYSQNKKIMSFEEQTARIESLISLIGSTKTGTAVEPAKKLGVSRRTIFKDIEFLRGSGLQIVFSLSDASYRFEKKPKKLQLF